MSVPTYFSKKVRKLKKSQLEKLLKKSADSKPNGSSGKKAKPNILNKQKTKATSNLLKGKKRNKKAKMRAEAGLLKNSSVANQSRNFN